MPGADALFTIAEVGVAFAGFASVVVVFGRRDDDGFRPADRIRFQLMISASLSVVLLAMLPFAFLLLGIDESVVWASCSIGFAVLTLSIIARTMRAALRSASRGGISRVVMWTTFAIASVAVALQLLNAAAIGFDREVGPYYAGLLCLLTVSAISFARLLPAGRDEQG